MRLGAGETLGDDGEAQVVFGWVTIWVTDGSSSSRSETVRGKNEEFLGRKRAQAWLKSQCCFTPTTYLLPHSQADLSSKGRSISSNEAGR